MVTEKRGAHPDLKRTLYEDVWAFNFFKAVHLLEGFSQGRSLGRQLSPRQDPVRFRVRPGFSFPASDILAIQNGHRRRNPEVTVNFMGLIGPKGVLPDWYNAHAQALNYQKDYAFTDFLDLFHHRLISLFYLAWKKYRLAENYRADGSDPISASLAGFIGMGGSERKADPEFARAAGRRLIYFTGLASRSVPTPAAVETILSNATGVPVRVRQFVERMIPVHEQDRTRLGRANSTLNQDALCGRRVSDRVSFFVVELGPMGWKKYIAFQPRSRNLGLIRKLITYIVGLEYEFAIQLILKGREIPSVPIGGGKEGAPVLGRTVLLKRPDRKYGKNIMVKETCVLQKPENSRSGVAKGLQ